MRRVRSPAGKGPPGVVQWAVLVDRGAERLGLLAYHAIGVKVSWLVLRGFRNGFGSLWSRRFVGRAPAAAGEAAHLVSCFLPHLYAHQIEALGRFLCLLVFQSLPDLATCLGLDSSCSFENNRAFCPSLVWKGVMIGQFLD